MAPKEAGRQINVASAAHGQVFYDHIDANNEPRGINGPMFIRKMCGGANMNGALINPDDFQGRNPKDRREKCSPWQTLVGNEQVVNPWPGMPLGLNIRVPTPVRKGDLVRANMHYRSTHDPSKPPTNSTLGLGNTWTGGVRNVDGSYPLKESEKKLTSKTVGTFGKTLGSYKADPNRFLKSYEKHPPLAYPTRFHYTDVVEPRPRPPRRDEIQPRVDAPETDFVTKNQVEAIVKGTKTLGGGWVGERAKQAVSGVDVVGSFGAPPPVATIGTVKMSGTKKGTRGLGAKDHAEMQLEAARRADIEAIVRGQALDNGERKARMGKIKRLQKTTERSKSTEPGAKSQMMRDSVPSRPATVMSNYEEGLTARSEAVSEYIAPDGKTVARMPEHVRKQMIRMLKRRWDEVNKEYQLLNLSLFNLDTVHKVNKKEACEAMMTRLEKDIMKLSKGTVYVEPEEGPSRPHSVAR